MNTEEKILTVLEGMSIRFDGLDARLGGIETRLNGIETRLEEMDARLDGMDSRLDRIEANISDIKKDAVVTRVAANQLIEWADRVGELEKIPFVAFS